MVKAQSDRMSYYYIQESTYGTTPNGGTVQALRTTSDSLAFEPTTIESPELDASGEVLDLILTNQRAAGGTEHVLSYGSFDNQLANLLRTHSGSGVGWNAAVTMAAGPSCTIASNVVTRGTGSFVSDGFTVGKWVKMTGWDDAANNTWGKISAVDATTMTLTKCTLTNDATGETDVAISQGSYIENGTTLGSETLISLYEDLDGGTPANAPARVFKGMTPNQATLTLTAGEIFGLSITWIGSSETDATKNTVTATPPTYSASPGAGNTPMNATSNVQTIKVGGNTYVVRSLSINIDNGVRERNAVGTLGAESLGLGKCRVTVNLEAYYENNTEYAKFTGNSTTDAWLVVQDIDGNQYLIELPKFKYSNFTRSNPGTGQDIIASCTATGIADATASGGKTIRITKWAA